MTRNTFWSQTYTGRAFYYDDPTMNEFPLEDIAHQLAMICRYGGACKYHYSVAQHSCALASWIMGQLNDPEFALYALFHDAAEAYIGDIRTPIKDHVAGIRQIESRIEDALFKYVREKCNVPLPLSRPERMKELDRRIVNDEKDIVMRPCSQRWYGMEGFGPLNADAGLFVKMPPEVAKALWLSMVEKMTEEVNALKAYRTVIQLGATRR